METAEYILDCVRTLLSWPVVVLAMALFLICKFRKQIGDFINRLESGSFYGVSFGTGGPSEQPKEAVEMPSLPVPEQIDPAEYVRSHPDEVIREYKNLVEMHWNERTFNLIYGSQLRLLEHLSTQTDATSGYPTLFPFHIEHNTLSGAGPSPPRPYFRFLIEMGLIEEVGDSPQVGARLTPRGFDFLAFVKRQYGYAFTSKPF